MSFAHELKEPAFAPRDVIAGKDARTLAEDLLAMTQEEFSTAFRKSPMKHAKLAELKRNAAAVLGAAGSPEEVAALATALEDPAPLVRASAAQERDEAVLAALRSALDASPA